jgi:hypothetical protein
MLVLHRLQLRAQARPRRRDHDARLLVLRLTDARCLWYGFSGSSAVCSTTARTRALSRTARVLVDPLRLREGEQTSEMGEVDYWGKKI